MRVFFLLFLLCLLTNNISAQEKRSDPRNDTTHNEHQSRSSEDSTLREKISIGPTILRYNLEPGQESSQMISIYNKTDKPYQFKVYMKDWERDSLGRHLHYIPGIHARSCASWLSVDKTFLDVPPGTIGRLKVTMKVPDTLILSDRGDTINTGEMKWTMLVLETMAEKKVGQKFGKITTQLGKQASVGIHVYQTPPSIESNKEVRMKSFRSTKDSRHYRIVGENTGATQLRCFFGIEAVSQETGEKISIPEVGYPLFPLQTRYVDLVVPESVPKGKYTLVATIDAGDDDIPLEAAQLEVEIE